jgi:hypothetical protein
MVSTIVLLKEAEQVRPFLIEGLLLPFDALLKCISSKQREGNRRVEIGNHRIR